MKLASEIIGFTSLTWAKLPDNKFDTVPLLDIIKIVEGKIREIKPCTLYVHHGGDLNIDHQIAFQSVMTAARPGRTTVKGIYCFETPSSSEWGTESFKPNTFVEISYSDLETKVKALECYTSEIRTYPHPRSTAGLRAHAEWYGMQAGVKYAEAFELVRKIN
jgi:LmbE family N-acetylglucosaminyl deacetylase